LQLIEEEEEHHEEEAYGCFMQENATAKQLIILLML
jgi:hypothetical protein